MPYVILRTNYLSYLPTFTRLVPRRVENWIQQTKKIHNMSKNMERSACSKAKKDPLLLVQIDTNSGGVSLGKSCVTYCA